MGAMALFDSHVEANPDDPAGYHGWAESALFEIQQNGNIDDKGVTASTRDRWPPTSARPRVWSLTMRST